MEQKQVEKLRRELRRKSLDQLIVYNPLKESFQTIYDGFTYVAPPQKESTFLRYIAIKWMREYIDYMINTEEQTAYDKENSKRRSKGWEPMNPQERDQFDIRNKYMTSDPEKRLGYMKVIFKGISQEHGLDLPEPTVVKRDRRPADEKMLEQLEKEMGMRDILPEDNFDIEDRKEELLKGVSNEN